jgi:hypothetical protein
MVAFCLALQAHPAILFHVSAILPEAQILGSTIDAQGEDPWHTVSRLRLAETEALPDAEWCVVTTNHPSETNRDVEAEYAVFREFPAVRDAAPLAFCVTARSWDEEVDLLALLEKLAVESEMRLVYRGVTGGQSTADLVMACILWVVIFVISKKIAGAFV